MMETMVSHSAKMLAKLGFTQLESEVYLFLLVNGENTGYAIAKGIGKAVANVYKAIESLSAKGAVEHSLNESKKCSAVPWKQLLNTEKRKFDKNLLELEQSLAVLPTQIQNEAVYQLNNVDQVISENP